MNIRYPIYEGVYRILTLYSSSLEKERMFSCKLLDVGKECFSSFIGLLIISSELHDDKTVIAKARLKSVCFILEKLND